MSRLKLKSEIIRILRNPELEFIFRNLRNFSSKEVLSPLFSCLCHPEEIVRWHAVSAFGHVVPAIANNNIEDGRIVMRRFLWMLNDESGGIGWGVPEAMAEVMSEQDILAQEYAHMLVSYSLGDGPELYQDGNFLEMPAMQQGLLWGLCRMVDQHQDRLIKHGVEANLQCYFSSTDSQVRGLVCRLSGMLGLASFKAMIVVLENDHHPVRLYQAGDFLDCRVSDLARRALRRMNSEN